MVVELQQLLLPRRRWRLLRPLRHSLRAPTQHALSFARPHSCVGAVRRMREVVTPSLRWDHRPSASGEARKKRRTLHLPKLHSQTELPRYKSPHITCNTEKKKDASVPAKKVDRAPQGVLVAEKVRQATLSVHSSLPNLLCARLPPRSWLRVRDGPRPTIRNPSCHRPCG